MAGLYVHVPFRRAHRSYDDGYYVVTDASDFSWFETALRQELQYYAYQYADDEPMTTVYAGGGRPSLLPLDTAHAILTTVVEVFDASTFEEATAEVTPTDADLRYLRTLKRMGFDRLSLPLLSFFPGDLEAIGAPHTADAAVRTLRLARRAGFETLSIDLLFGWPEQSFQDWKANLRQAVEMDVPHITILENPTAADNHAAEIQLAKCLEFAMTFLQSEGYQQYELTHFAQPGHQSAHQTNYYAHGNHLGLGPAAQTFWWPTRTPDTPARRWSNVSDIKQYVELLNQRYSPVAYRQTLSRLELAREYILLRLRTDEGLDLNVLSSRYSVDLSETRSSLLDRLKERELIFDDPDQVRLTNRGRLVADAITARLLPEE